MVSRLGERSSGFASRARRLIGVAVVGVVLVAAAVGAASPAAGQDGARRVPVRVVTLVSPRTAGTYTVSWRTLGGCDPGAGTSGMAGEVVLAVEATGRPDDDPVPGELTGTPAVGVVVVSPICVYTWTVSMVEATTDGNCIVGPAPFEPDDDFEINITLDDPGTSCSQRSRIVVRVHPAVAVDVDETDHNALLRTAVSAAATPVEGAPKGCVTRTGTSKVNDNDTPSDTTDDTVSIEVLVVDATATGQECRYDVTLKTPGHLVATHGEREFEVFRNVDPLVTIDFRVGVVSRTIYLLQSVAGDSRAANAHYSLSTSCGDPSPLPPPMPSAPAEGGIEATESVTLVELREGRFNITAAIADDPTAQDAFDGVARRVLDNRGEVCEVTVSVSRMPDRCVAEHNELTIDLTRAPEPTILEFNIACSDDIAATTGAGTPQQTGP